MLNYYQLGELLCTCVCGCGPARATVREALGLSQQWCQAVLKAGSLQCPPNLQDEAALCLHAATVVTGLLSDAHSKVRTT